MKLYVMRHGPADDTSPTGRDGDRALTPEGRERTRSVARALVAENEAPVTIISSPLVRALQTAEIVASVTNVAVEIRRDMAPGGDPLHMVTELQKSGRKRVMVVGHEPDLSMLVSSLVARHLEQGFLKSMVVGLRMEDAGNTQRFVLDPKTLTWQRD